MRSPARLALAVLAGLTLATSGAGARNFSVSEQRFRASWAGLEFDLALISASCPVTLTGSFHRRTIVKTTALVGAIVGATVNSERCTGGTYRPLPSTLPWHVRYVSFSGTLPAIERVRVAIVGLALQATFGGAVCLFRTDTTEPLIADFVVGAGGATRELQVDPSAEIDLEDDRFLCVFAGDMFPSGTASVVNDTGGIITVRLI